MKKGFITAGRVVKGENNTLRHCKIREKGRGADEIGEGRELYREGPLYVYLFYGNRDRLLVDSGGTEQSGSREGNEGKQEGRKGSNNIRRKMRKVER